MTFEVQQKRIPTENMLPVGGVTFTDASNMTVPVGQGGSETTNPMCVELSKASNAVQKTKRTADELYNSLASICQANGLNLAEVKKSGLLSFVSGKTEEELLNVEQAEINKIINQINTAINTIKEDIDAIKQGEKPLTIQLIKNYIKLNNVVVPAGWDSVESFRKAQKKGSAPESLSNRLKRMYGCDVSTLSKEQLAQKLEAYFDGYFYSIQKSGKSKEEVDTLQLSDFSKLLFNSTKEEYSMFRDAIEYLVVNNRHKGYNAILESFDTAAEKTQFSNETSYEQVKVWNTKADQRGEVPSSKIATQNTAAALKYKDKEHIEEYHEAAKQDALEFYTEENKEKLSKITEEQIKSIQDKIAKIEEYEAIKAKKEAGKEALTAEEENILQNPPAELTEQEKETLELYAKDKHYRGDNAGQIVGVGINTVISNEDKKTLLQTMSTDAYTIGEKAGNDFYRNVMEQVSDFVNDKENEKLLTMSKDDFVKLMDEVTEGNYSTVVSDKAKGTKTELVAPTAKKSSKVEVTSDSNSSEKDKKGSSYGRDYGYGYELTGEQPTITSRKMEEIYSQADNTTYVDSRTTTPSDLALNDVVQTGSVEAVKNYAKESGNGYIKTAIELLDQNLPSCLKDWALAKFDLLNNGLKAMACNRMKNNSNKMEAGSRITSLAALQDVQCTNGIVRKHFENLIEEKQELMV